MKNNGRAIRWTAILLILGFCVAVYLVGWFQVCAVETVSSAEGPQRPSPAARQELLTVACRPTPALARHARHE